MRPLHKPKSSNWWSNMNITYMVKNAISLGIWYSHQEKKLFFYELSDKRKSVFTSELRRKQNNLEIKLSSISASESTQVKSPLRYIKVHLGSLTKYEDSLCWNTLIIPKARTAFDDKFLVMFRLWKYQLKCKWHIRRSTQF